MQHAKIDADAEKDIPASAWEQMRHKPYQGGKRNEKTDDTKEGHEPGHGHAGQKTQRGHASAGKL